MGWGRMSRLLFFLSFFVFCFSARSQTCDGIDSRVGKLSISSDGTILKVGEHRVPIPTGTYFYSVLKNAAGLPAEITAKRMDDPFLLPLSVGEKISFEYDSKGACHLKRILGMGMLKMDRVTYDRKLCEKLSGAFNRIKKDEMEKCNQIVSDMAKAIDEFKEEIKKTRTVAQ